MGETKLPSSVTMASVVPHSLSVVVVMLLANSGCVFFVGNDVCDPQECAAGQQCVQGRCSTELPPRSADAGQGRPDLDAGPLNDAGGEQNDAGDAGNTNDDAGRDDAGAENDGGQSGNADGGIADVDAGDSSDGGLQNTDAGPTPTDVGNGFRRLTKEQFNRTLSDLHGQVWVDAWTRSEQTSWFRDASTFHALLESRAYPEDAHQAAPGEPRGGFRRHDQVIHDTHVTSWIGASMQIANDDYEQWVGHLLVFRACERDNANGVTNFASPEEVMENCIDTFIVEFGAKAFRRTLSPDEIVFFRSVFDDSEAAYPNEVFDHFAGYGWRARALRNVIAVMTNAPEFLYHVEVGDDNGNLTAFELASRLSYHFWNTMPDAELFAVAEDGTLFDDAVYAAQVARLTNDPRALRSIDEFYRDFFRVQDIPNIRQQSGSRNYHAFPQNTYGNASGRAKEAMEDELANLGKWFTHDSPGTYEEMFRSNLHFLECQYPQHDPTRCDGAGPYSEFSYAIPNLGGWDGESTPITLPEPERVGLLTRLALLGHDTIYARPIRRGIYIREALMCEPVPPPQNCEVVKPPEVDVYSTVREKVEALTEADGTTCQGCHGTLINPFGHALGQFSSLGQYWPQEHMFTDQQNAEGEYWYFLAEPTEWRDIDTTSSAWVGDQLVDLDGAASLANALVSSGELERCWSREYFRFTLGRFDTPQDTADIDALAEQMRQGMSLKDAFASTVFMDVFKTLDHPFSAPESP